MASVTTAPPSSSGAGGNAGAGSAPSASAADLTGSGGGVALDGSWVAPGDRLGQATQFSGVGAGCYVRGDHVYASVVGVCRVTNEGAGGGADGPGKGAAAGAVVSVAAPHAEPPVVPDVGNVVTAKVRAGDMCGVGAVVPVRTGVVMPRSRGWAGWQVLTVAMPAPIPHAGAEYYAASGARFHRVRWRDGTEGPLRGHCAAGEHPGGGDRSCGSASEHATWRHHQGRGACLRVVLHHAAVMR